MPLVRLITFISQLLSIHLTFLNTTSLTSVVNVPVTFWVADEFGADDVFDLDGDVVTAFDGV